MKQSKFYLLALLLIAAIFMAACQATPAATTPTDEAPVTDEVDENTNDNEAEPPTETAEPVENENENDNTGTEPGAKVEVRWFVGLGAGSDQGTIAPQEAFVEAFNAQSDTITLVIEIVDNPTATDTLSTQIAAGNAPDIVGPVGIAGRDKFKGAWLDLNPLIEANNYDLAAFDPATVEFLEVKEEGQLGIPFAIYPSFTFVNKDLFDEAGLPYPPQEYGQPYVDENGDEHEWDMETLREVAMKLTVDANGVDATSADFDPENIVQFGYLNQFTDMRGALTMFGAGNFVADDNETAQVPDQWREGAQWVHDAMWKDHFWPTDAYVASDVLATPNPFASGHLAMATVHMWYAAAWALGEIDFVWDTAISPSYNGVTTAKMHADTFGILKGSEHPQEAFEVLTYMLSEEHATDLLTIYGGMPARLSLQGDYFENYSATVFPGQDINWQVVADSAAYADHPNHEAYMPSYVEASTKAGEYWTRWAQEPEVDINSEIDQLIEDLQAIFDAATS